MCLAFAPSIKSGGDRLLVVMRGGDDEMDGRNGEMEAERDGDEGLWWSTSSVLNTAWSVRSASALVRVRQVSQLLPVMQARDDEV